MSLRKDCPVIKNYSHLVASKGQKTTAKRQKLSCQTSSKNKGLPALACQMSKINLLNLPTEVLLKILEFLPSDDSANTLLRQRLD